MMKRPSHESVFAFFVSVVTVFAMSAATVAAQTTTCPPCVKNWVPLPGHGAAADGRLIIKVYNDSSSDSAVRGATQDAMNAWNNATDPFANKTCYYFEPTTNSSQADIVVGTALGFRCARNLWTETPRKIHINITDVNARALIAKLIMHELGHCAGLANSKLAPVCSAGQSIMTWAYYPGCSLSTPSVRPVDVQKSNQNCSNPASCDENLPTGSLGVGPYSCPLNNSCQNYFGGPIPAQNPDPCQYQSSCSQGFNLGYVSGVQCCIPTQTPIIVDVAGNGFDLTDAAGGVAFDTDASGEPNLVSWTAVDSDDAWLTLDRNGNGEIDNGSELFGNYTDQPFSEMPNGFLALAEFDKVEYGGNGNGRIDGRDEVFRELRLWQDKNHNGKAEIDELNTLPELGFAAISLTYDDSNWIDIHGNQFKYRARVLRRGVLETPSDRTARWAFDVILLERFDVSSASE